MISGSVAHADTCQYMYWPEKKGVNVGTIFPFSTLLLQYLHLERPYGIQNMLLITDIL